MTVDIRAAAEAESDRRYAETPFAPENEPIADAFVDGAVWAQAQLTPTREQIAGKKTATTTRTKYLT